MHKQVFPDLATLHQAAADLLIVAAQASLGARGRWVVALGGGTTPRPVYALLAAEPRRSQIDWSKVVVFWGDERCVPPDDPQSNYRMAYEALLKHVPIPEAQIYRIHGEDDPLHAASEYAATIRTVLDTPDAMPAFDTIILGIGADGHIASLFPGTLLLAEREALVTAGWVPQQNQHRVSLTLPLINATHGAMFIVAGDSKAPTVRRIAQGDQSLPATLVKPATPPLWMLDAAAAAEL